VPSAGELRLCRLDFNDFSLQSDDMLLAAIRIFHDTRLIDSFNIDYDVCTIVLTQHFTSASPPSYIKDKNKMLLYRCEACSEVVQGILRESYWWGSGGTN